jgi:hypothetical protein
VAITILDLAIHRGAEPDEEGCYSAAEIHRTGLPFMGGCELCGATIAAYNAAPSKSGFLRCAKECVEGAEYSTVEEADAALFPKENEKCSCCDEDPCVHADEIPDGWGEP